MKAFDPKPKDDREYQIITEISEMIALEPEWNELWRKAKGAFYQSYSTAYHSWNEISAPSGRTLFCVTIREKGRLVLVFPLVRYRNGPCSIVRPLGPDAAETTDVLVDPDVDRLQTVELAWRTIEMFSRVDIIRMPFLKVGSMLDKVVNRRNNLVCVPDVAPYADLQDLTNWDEYARIIGANSRQQLNRKRKRLSELGHFEFAEVDPVAEPERAIELMDWMFAQKKVWSDRVGKQGPWITSEHYRRFIQNWISDPNNSQTMRIYTILIDKVPIAMKLAAYSIGHMDLIIAAFHADPQYSKYSPGFVLDEFWMKIVFEKRLNVDFGAGNEPYKLFWSRGLKADVMSYHVPLTLIGNTAARLWRLKLKADAHRAQRRRRHEETARAA